MHGLTIMKFAGMPAGCTFGCGGSGGIDVIAASAVEPPNVNANNAKRTGRISGFIAVSNSKKKCAG